MSLLGEQVLLRINLQSADRAPLTPTYERIVKAARSQSMAGCTVMRGIMGLLADDLLKPAKWSFVEHAPVIIEIIDRALQIQHFVEQTLPQLSVSGFCTLERANVMMYRDRKHDQSNNLQLGSILTKPLSTIPKIQTGDSMTINENGVLLRIFAGESDQADGKPLYEAILQQARQIGVAGATVLRGSEGFGANSVVHKARLLEMSSDLPIVIEIVDSEPKIQQLLPYLERVVHEGMITMEHVSIVFYRHNPSAPTR